MLTVDKCYVCVRVEEGGGLVGEEEGKRIPSIFFFLLQNDMRYIIPYSFSQQNEFYKVLLYKKCHSSTKTVFIPSLSFTASVPLQNYLQVFKYIHPLLSIESH